MTSISRMIAIVAAAGLMLAAVSSADAVTPMQGAPAQGSGLLVQVHGHGGMGGGHMGGGFRHHGVRGLVGPVFYDYGPEYYGPDYYYAPVYTAGAYCYLVRTAAGPRRACDWPHRHRHHWRHHFHRHHHH